jgi:hypothetical protein
MTVVATMMPAYLHAAVDDEARVGELFRFCGVARGAHFGRRYRSVSAKTILDRPGWRGAPGVRRHFNLLARVPPHFRRRKAGTIFSERKEILTPKGRSAR